MYSSAAAPARSAEDDMHRGNGERYGNAIIEIVVKLNEQARDKSKYCQCIRFMTCCGIQYHWPVFTAESRYASLWILLVFQSPKHTRELISEEIEQLQEEMVWLTFQKIVCTANLTGFCGADVEMFSRRLKWSTPHPPTTVWSCFAHYPLAVQSTLPVRSDGALPNHLTVKDSRRCRWRGAMTW